MSKFYFVANPDNGAPVSHDGVELPVSHQVALDKHLAVRLVHRYPFLMLHVVEADAKAVIGKVVALAGPLRWEPTNVGTDEVPEPDSVKHVVPEKAAASGAGSGAAPRRVRAPRAPKPAAAKKGK